MFNDEERKINLHMELVTSNKCFKFDQKDMEVVITKLFHKLSPLPFTI